MEHCIVKKIYIGNLPWSATEAELTEMFTKFGSVASASIVTDRETGRSRGFGFLEMNEAEDADKAIQALDGTELGGRALRVNEAEQRERRGRH